jgi:hypothetical protein
MAPPKDIARSYPKRGLTADVGFRSEPKFCGDGSAEFATGEHAQGTYTNTLNSTLSMCCWVKVYAVQQIYFMDIGANSSKAQISISYHNGTGAGINKRPYIWNGSAVITATQEMEINEWHHLAVTSASGAGNIKIYLDGVDVTPSHSTDVTITTNNIYLGKWIPGSGNFDGKMANAALFRTTLTQEQVRECMRASSFSEFDAISTLEAFYPLDANFNDSTSGGHDLTATGSPSFTVDRPQLPRGLDLARGAGMARCFTGRAVDFDGSSDRLTAAHYNPSGDYLTTTAWVNADTLRGQGLIHNGDTGRNAFLFYMSGATGDLDFYWNDTTGDARIRHQTQLSTGQWYHLAAVMDMSDAADHQVTWYINGIAATGTRTSASWVGDNTYQFGNQYSAAGWFDGKIADCRIYDVALTQAQIRELYHNPEQVLPTGVSASNLRRHYPLSDYNDTGGTGGRWFQDMGADDESAEDKGSALMAFAQPVPCPQLALQQSASRIHWDDNTAEKLSATIPALGTDFTIAFWWFRGSSTSADVWLEVNTPGLYQIYYDLSQIVYYSTTAGVFYTGVSCAEGEWSHIGLTQNGVYKNGVLYPHTGSLDWLGTEYRIFGRHAASLACSGTCSNMAFWSDALTTAEMLELYNQGPDYDPRNDTGNYASSDTLQNLWLMDDLATVKDRKGSNDLTVIGSPIMQSFPENASGSTIVGDFSMKRKGVSVLNCFNDSPAQGVRTEIPKGAGLAPSLTDGHAVSVWYRNQKQDTTSANNGTMITFGTASGTDRFIIEALNGNSFRGIYGNVTANSTATISDNNWHHYAMVLDVTTSPNPTVRVYLDGVAAGTATGALGTTFPDALTTIGWMTTGKTSFNYGLKGPLACPRIYAFQLSENEIKQIYNSDLRLIKGLENE